MNKLVLFGAGKIGRSFIAQLFSLSGYETVFVDIDPHLVELINQKKAYDVLVKDTKEERIRVTNVRALHFGETVSIRHELASASIAAISVGQKGLPAVIPVVAQGLMERFDRNPGLPLDIIIAENIRNADVLLKSQLKQLLPEDYPANELIGIIESSIGKMVPVMTPGELEKDPLLIFAEAYNELPVDANAFKNPIPDVQGLLPKSNMKAWVDRKSFIHNLGHATAAYVGYRRFPQTRLLWEVLDDTLVYEATRRAMLQSAGVLSSTYASEFTFSQLETHVDDLLKRFRNKALGDTVHRVGCDLYRKLGPNDRLAGAIHLAKKENLPHDHIWEALVAGFSFKATDHDHRLHAADERFHQELKEEGFPAMFKKVTGFDYK